MAGTALPRKIITALHSSSNSLFVSTVTVWEIINKPKLGRGMEEIRKAVADVDASILSIQLDHLEELEKLSSFQNHTDPFDRLLIAQAVSEDLTMVSSDTRFTQYPELTLLWE